MQPALPRLAAKRTSLARLATQFDATFETSGVPAVRYLSPVLCFAPHLGLPIVLTLPSIGATTAGVLLAAALATATFAQDAPRTRVALPPAASPEEFTRIVSLRELPDGRVLIADATDNRIVVLDLALGTATNVGRIGSGPNEFRLAGSLIALGADTTLVVDPPNGRFLVLVGSTVLGTVSSSQREFQQIGLFVLGADSLGHLVGLRQHRAAPTPRGRVGIMELVKVSRASGNVQMIANDLKGREFATPSGSATDGIRLQSVVYAAPEQAVLFRDGWLAIARQEPYRVDWVRPDGTRQVGAVLPWSHPPVTLAIRARWAASARSSNGGRTVAADQMTFADRVPPFLTDAVHESPSGDVLIRRSVLPDSTTATYDIIGRDGHLRRQFTLPKEARVIGRGSEVLYLAVRDEDDVERLHRLPWPTRPTR